MSKKKTSTRNPKPPRPANPRSSTDTWAASEAAVQGYLVSKGVRNLAWLSYEFDDLNRRSTILGTASTYMKEHFCSYTIKIHEFVLPQHGHVIFYRGDVSEALALQDAFIARDHRQIGTLLGYAPELIEKFVTGWPIIEAKEETA